MLKTIQIKNLKSIVDSGPIELKPLTVVIGKNSSGKSSFLRVFPLLKQSYVVNLSEPILWYGDYVDFGSFRNTLNSECAKGDCIEFIMTFENVTSLYSLNATKIANINVSMSIKERSIAKYEININNKNKIVLEEHDGKKYNIIINDEKIDCAPLVLVDYRTNKFPVYVSRGEGELYFPFYSIPKEIFDKYLDTNQHERYILREDRILDINKQISLGSAKTKAYKIFKEVIKAEKEIEEDDLVMIANMLIRNTVVDVLSSVEDTVANTFRSVQYFQPLRSRGDRFYRVQGLNTKEIDSDGNNGPMFLYNMEKEKEKEFEKWCFENFGFAYSISKFGDGLESTSITIKNKLEKTEHNLTDTGFGYSQIFPIILSLWNYTENQRRSNYERIIVIEQPELHLHPSFQKRIMNAIVKIIEIAKKKRMGIKFIIETHSETIVNYLGKLISNNYDNNSDINLLVCDMVDKKSRFEKMIFNKDGLIENWPNGFFSDDE